MPKSGANSRGLLAKAGLLLGALAFVAGGVVLYRFASRDEIPKADLPDIQEGTRAAARVSRLSGQVYARAAAPGDEEPSAVPVSLPSGQALPSGWSALSPEGVLTLGTLIQAEAKSAVEIMTHGQWHLGLDGPGAAVLLDARRNAEGTEHLLSVFVQKGLFRAKSGPESSKGYFLEVSTGVAKIRVFEGEFGMDVQAGGIGRMWLMSGRAVALWKDGRRKELGLRGLEDL